MGLSRTVTVQDMLQQYSKIASTIIYTAQKHSKFILIHRRIEKNLASKIVTSYVSLMYLSSVTTGSVIGPISGQYPTLQPAKI